MDSIIHARSVEGRHLVELRGVSLDVADEVSRQSERKVWVDVHHYQAVFTPRRQTDAHLNGSLVILLGNRRCSLPLFLKVQMEPRD